jgi:hypothetical protein
VTITGYDGRRHDAYLYCAKNPKDTEVPCSQRYLNVLVNGARAAGLNENYIRKLAALPTYKATPEIVKLRESLPAMEDLPRMTVAELAASKPKDDATDQAQHVLVSVMGYVLKVPRDKVSFGRHKARDITTRQSRQWRGLPLDDNDDFGHPPFRLPAGIVQLSQPCDALSVPALGLTSEDDEQGSESGGMTPAEHEFVLTWLDHYLWKAGGRSGVVAFVSELRGQWERTRQEVRAADTAGA